MKKILLPICLVLFAFIVFLVVTPIEEDKEILTKLPPWSENESDVTKLKERNVLSILVNNKNELIVREKKMEVKNLRSEVKEFISNPNQDALYAEDPKKAIVSIGNEKGTDYKIYLTVFNEIKSAYNELRDEKAMVMFGKKFEEINSNQQKEIRSIIPLVISEAEPTDFDEGN